MEYIANKINKYGEDIINDNDFLLVAFENRLILRIVHIFEKYKIPVNKNMIRKNLEIFFLADPFCQAICFVC